LFIAATHSLQNFGWFYERSPGTSEDFAAVLVAAAGTSTLTKRSSAPDGKARRDLFYVRQLDSDENEVTIKYRTKAPDQPGVSEEDQVSRHSEASQSTARI
jgi:hypothetical protein